MGTLVPCETTRRCGARGDRGDGLVGHADTWQGRLCSGRWSAMGKPPSVHAGGPSRGDAAHLPGHPALARRKWWLGVVPGPALDRTVIMAKDLHETSEGYPAARGGEVYLEHSKDSANVVKRQDQFLFDALAGHGGALRRHGRNEGRSIV